EEATALVALARADVVLDAHGGTGLPRDAAQVERLDVRLHGQIGTRAGDEVSLVVGARSALLVFRVAPIHLSHDDAARGVEAREACDDFLRLAEGWHG